jgi:hypothetical protein
VLYSRVTAKQLVVISTASSEQALAYPILAWPFTFPTLCERSACRGSPADAERTHIEFRLIPPPRPFLWLWLSASHCLYIGARSCLGNSWSGVSNYFKGCVWWGSVAGVSKWQQFYQGDGRWEETGCVFGILVIVFAGFKCHVPSRQGNGLLARTDSLGNNNNDSLNNWVSSWSRGLSQQMKICDLIKKQMSNFQ